MCKWGYFRSLSAALCLVFLSLSTVADETEDFYTGRQVKIITGAGLGGSYGLYLQLVAKHIERHIPGSPRVIVESMPGAGGLRALNYAFNVAPADGSVLLLAHQEVVAESILSEDARFNAAEFGWIGRLVDAPFVGFASRASGVRNLEDAKTRHLVAGATGLRSETAVAPELSNRLAGTDIKIVSGYQETRRMVHALKQGELEVVTLSYLAALSLYGAELDAGEMVPIYATGALRLDAFPEVPTISEFARTAEDKLFLEVYGSGSTIGRSLAVPPGVPHKRLVVLRGAFQNMLQDPAFQADLADRNILISPLSGEELESYIAKVMHMTDRDIAVARAVYAQLLAGIRK